MRQRIEPPDDNGPELPVLTRKCWRGTVIRRKAKSQLIGQFKLAFPKSKGDTVQRCMALQVLPTPLEKAWIVQQVEYYHNHYLRNPVPAEFLQ